MEYPTHWKYLLKLSGYTLALFLAQVHWVSRFSQVTLRVDLLLPLMVGVALERTRNLSLFWAFFWGYVADVFSGKCWGFHVGCYLSTVCLVVLASRKVELRNAFYRTFFVGVCALGQSMVLGLLLWLDVSELNLGVSEMLPTWRGLLLRALVMMLMSPLIMYPIWEKDAKSHL